VIRFIIKTADVGEAIYAGGNVITRTKSFDVDCPELEAHLREHRKAEQEAKGNPLYWSRELVGYELLDLKHGGKE